MSIRCIIIEDQPLAQRVLKRYIDDCPQLELVETFVDPIKGLDFLKKNEIDAIFLDIHLPKLSGLEFLSVLEHKPQVILTTAFSEYALKSYELDVTDYLLKPFSFERFLIAVNKLSGKGGSSASRVQSKSEEQNYAFVKLGHDYVRISFEDILFVKAEKDYTKIFLEDAKHLVSHTLKYWTEKLPSAEFCQVHKSFLVNVSKINKVVGNQLLIGDEQIPIGRVFKGSFTKKYLES